MPELPEVETIKSELEPCLVGRKFEEVVVGDATAVQGLPAGRFQDGLAGRTVCGLARRGKFFIVRLDNKQALIIHLRMTGNLILEDKDRSLPSQLTHARVRATFKLDNGRVLAFIDRRRLGRVWLVNDEKEIVGKLGPEPLGDDFSSEVFAKLLARHRAPIKAVLCDQRVVAGIGNMYADEVLYEARIHPLTLANKLSPRATSRLHSAIRSVLAKAIANKGASVDTYFRPDCRQGTAHHEFKVAHHLHDECPLCGGKVQRIVVRGRGTYFCPRCQKLGRSR